LSKAGTTAGGAFLEWLEGKTLPGGRADALRFRARRLATAGAGATLDRDDDDPQHPAPSSPSSRRRFPADDTAGPAAAETPSQAPGQRFEIDPGKLPAPYATDAVANSADLIDRPSPPPSGCRRASASMNSPVVSAIRAGWRWLPTRCVSHFAAAGQVLLLRDKDGDGKAELKTVFAAGFQRAHGLAIQEGYLYVAGTDGLWRVKLGGDRATGKPEMVTKPDAFGAGCITGRRNVAFPPTASASSSPSAPWTISRGSPAHATVQSFAADGSDQKTFAAGLRNPVGVAFYPDQRPLHRGQ